MREFLISVIGVIFISLLVEVVFPTKKMKGAVALGFSLVVVFILVGGIKNLFSDNKLNFKGIEILTQNEEILDATVFETENQLKSHLNNNGFYVRDIKLIISDENSLKFSGVEIKIYKDVDEEKLKDKILEIIEVERENIWVKN